VELRELLKRKKSWMMATTPKELVTSLSQDDGDEYSNSNENPVTAYDWSNERVQKMQDAGISPVEVEFFDDGTVTFFWLVFLCYKSTAFYALFLFRHLGGHTHYPSCSS